jgi:hypothetical protein
LRHQLSECKKLDSSAHDYYNKVKTLSDRLTSTGQPLHDAEFTEYVLAGLDSDYDNLIEKVNNRDNPMLLIRPKHIYFPEHFCYYFSSNLCVLNTNNTD